MIITELTELMTWIVPVEVVLVMTLMPVVWFVKVVEETLMERWFNHGL